MSKRSKLLGSRFACECGATHAVPVREALIGPGAVAGLPGLLRRLDLSGPAWLLADGNTMQAAGERVVSLLAAARIEVRTRVLPGRPRSEKAFADAIADELPANARLVISCGSGTITDLGKWAAHRRGIPLVAVATAPSMNGYASGIAALIEGGLKATTPVTPAIAVVADTEVLAAAPMEMIRAGLGDLLSKPVCNADWRLSTLLRGGRFCGRPFALVKDLEAIYAGRSHLIPKRDVETIGALSEALIYSGVSMLLAGSSEPASGGEHLVSHVLDMLAHARGELPDFHGAQVGVGTLVTAALYERLLAIEPAELDRGALDSVWERGEALLESCRGFYGAAFPSVAEQFRRKRGSREQASAEARAIAARWDELRAAVRPFLMPAERIREILAAAGAKTSFAELGVEAATSRELLRTAHCVRSRFTVLDVAFALGLSPE